MLVLVYSAFCSIFAINTSALQKEGSEEILHRSRIPIKGCPALSIVYKGN